MRFYIKLSLVGFSVGMLFGFPYILIAHNDEIGVISTGFGLLCLVLLFLDTEN